VTENVSIESKGRSFYRTYAIQALILSVKLLGDGRTSHALNKPNGLHPKLKAHFSRPIP